MIPQCELILVVRIAMSEETMQEMRDDINTAVDIEQRFSEPGRFSNDELRTLAREIAALQDTHDDPREDSDE